MKKLKELTNIGPTIQKKLNAIGVYTPADLADLTSAGAYQKLQEQANHRLPHCYYLYSLQGALMDMHWDDISDDMKKELRMSVT